MRQLNTIQTCRRLISCVPLCKAVSTRSITAEAVMNKEHQSSIPIQQTSGNNYAEGIFKPVRQSITLDIEKQYKMKFLMRCPKFMEKVISFTESEIGMELKGYNLQLLGSQPDLALFEELLIKELNSDSVGTQKVDIPIQPRLALALYSTSHIVSQIKNGDKVQLKLNACGPTDINSLAVTGNQKDVNEFLKELAVKLNSVSVNKFFLPSHLVPSMNFSKMQEFNQLPNTFCSVIKGEFEFWTCDPSTKELAEAQIKEFIASQTVKLTESITLSVLMKHYIFTLLDYQASKHVNITWKSYDGNTITMEVQGPLSEVHKTKKEVQQRCNEAQRVEMNLPTCFLEHFDSSSIRSDLFMVVPTKENPKLILLGKEHRINETLIEIYRGIQAFCSPKEFSKIETSIALSYSYANSVMFQYDKENIKLFKSTFPEATIDCVHLPDESINVQVTANIIDLDAINKILKRHTVVPFSSSSRNTHALNVAQVLQRNERINSQVKIEQYGAYLLLSGPNPEDVEEAKELLWNLIELNGFQYRSYTSTGRLLVSNNLLDEIKTVAAEYEVFVDFKADPSSGDALVIDIVGGSGNCMMFKNFLRSKLDHLDHLSLLPGRTREWVLQRCLDQQIKDRIGLFVLYNPELKSHWLGGERHAVQEVFDSIKMYEKNVSWQRLPVHNPQMENYLKNQFDRLKFSYPEVDVAINNENDRLNVDVIGRENEATLVSIELKRIMSETCVSGSRLNKEIFGEGRSQIFRMAMHNCKQDEKVLFKLWSNKEDGITLQMIGQTNNVDKCRRSLPSRSDGEHGNYHSVIELPYTSKIYLKYLETRLGIPVRKLDESGFQIHSLFYPKVRCSKNWNWDGLKIKPDNRAKWVLSFEGKRTDVQEAEKRIKEAMNGIYFRQLKIKCLNYSFIRHILMKSELWSGVLPDPDVHFYTEFYDYENEICYLNFFGDNKAKEGVEELITQLLHYISEESKSVSFDARDYTNLNENKLSHFKSCFLHSDIAKELSTQRDQFAWYYDPEAHTIVMIGKKEPVSVYEQKVRNWLERFTLETKVYDDYETIGARVRYPRHHQYCYKRWPIGFIFNQNFGCIDYFGLDENVANFKEYLDNEVVSAYKIGSADQYKKIKRYLAKIANLYSGVFIKEDYYEHKLVLIGEKLDVASVKELLDVIVAGDDINKFILQLETGDRVINIPFGTAECTIGGTKMRNLFPKLNYYLEGRKIVFKGPQDVVDEAVDLIGNMTMIQVPDSIMKSSTLFKDHRDTAETFKDSHFIPSELTDRVFIRRNKGDRGNKKVDLMGHTEDVTALKQYIKRTLPQSDVECRTIPLASEHAAMILRSQRGWRSLFSDFEDKVAYSIEPTHVEVAGNSEHVSLLISQLENFLHEFEVVEIPLPGQGRLWDRICRDISFKEIRMKYPKVWLFNGNLNKHLRNGIHYIVGDKEQVKCFEELMLEQIRLRNVSKNNMSEDGLWHMHVD